MIFDWFVSYIVNRVQYVNVDGFDSTFLHVKCGVPEGPFVHNIYIYIYIYIYI